MNRKLFVAGTDTEVGKTYISVGLLRAFQDQGLSALGFKPLASGCTKLQDRLVNQDALLLQRASSIQLPYEKINPFAFEPPIAPHIAAQETQTLLSVKALNTPIFNHAADIHLIEGIGGWYVPLNDKETMADYVCHNKLPVLLVIGIRLGCINHGILTYKAMQQDHASVIGWIANRIDPLMPFWHENIKALQNWLPVPLLSTVDYNERPEDKMDIKKIVSVHAMAST